MTWRCPAPGLGSKKRDAQLVADKLAEWKPELIVLPFAGLGGELVKYEGGAKLIVADNDPAVRAVWIAANKGLLEQAGRRAARGWKATMESMPALTAADWMRRMEDRWGRRDPAKRLPLPTTAIVAAAWDQLRKGEKKAESSPISYAAWALAYMAGSIGGRRRRNGKGVVNIPYPQPYDPDWLPRRIAKPERLREADAFAKGRVLAVPYDWRHAFSATEKVMSDYSEVVLLVDPPYGHEDKRVYGGDWTEEQRDELAKTVRHWVKQGAHAVSWCGKNDIGAWKPTRHEFDDIFEWNWRPAKTHMKQGGARKDGKVEKNRSAEGGWLGVSR